jgi:hypothetical protein
MLNRKAISWGVAVAALLGSALPSLAQTTPKAPAFVQLKGDVMGALYMPSDGPPPSIGVIVMHRESNYMSNIACTEFSKRGFAALCMNSSFHNNEASVDWENIPLDVAQGMNYLRKLPGLTKVVLYGNSGGGVTMSFYQAVAENGPSVCQGENKLIQCDPEKLKGLTPADAIIITDGHPGNPILRLRSLNPALSADLEGTVVDASLDPYDPKNGYKPDGSSTYSADFKKRYFEAQAKRMNGLIELAQKKLADIKAGKSFYTDDAPFSIPGFDGGRLQSLDLSIRHTTIEPVKFLKNDGSVVTQSVDSIAPPRPQLAKANRTFSEGARGGLTVKSFLTSNAIKSTDALDEKKIDLCSSNNSTPCMLGQVKAPLLAAAMQGSFQNLIQEIEINAMYAKMADKEFIVVEGATTSITPCDNCGQPKEAFANVTKNFFDYAAKWIKARVGA